MLIIFDLDDTLIDTSGSLIPYQLKRVFDSMGHLQFPNKKKALSHLLKINEKSLTAVDCIKEFITSSRGNEEDVHKACEFYYGSFPEDFPIRCFKGAKKILTKLSQKHDLALVTRGEERIQRMKLKKAGIDTSLFSKIEVVSDGDKKRFYQQIVGELRYTADTVYVCGDRFEVDLQPARELGYHTILIKWGRGKNTAIFDDQAEYSIHRLEEILAIIRI